MRKRQNEFTSWKFGMFVHFNMGTFVNREWATGYEDPLLFSPAKLSCEQWAKEAKNAGMKYIVLTTKHTGGWCLWDSKYTTKHDITVFKNYKNGKGDIVRDFVDAARKYGLKVGLYYCLPGDYSQKLGSKRDQTVGYKITAQQDDLHGLPPEARGDYAGFVEKQVAELLTNYGPIDMIWFDQYTNKYTGKHWLQLKGLVHRLQPKCVLIANNSRDYKTTDIYSYEYPYLAKNSKPGPRALPGEDENNPGEVSDCIATTNWLWNNEVPLKLQSAKTITERLNFCNERSTNYLLNVQPDREGLISGDYLKRLREVGKVVLMNRKSGKEVD
ncbi:alpha-L-fucosidase [Niabella ginsengisoli]|uniref:alpha-L-fucosidase n=1 Tax=Niabella ginsengisoli TaxID=522298 RepID=A0ABS9SGM5_9BACT|nr:alpha-L-fucosidase [Niabella ginsengisoli]MCH5597500.1 alpha-L-fucosidase [Niabella ginsengisoli]